MGDRRGLLYARRAGFAVGELPTGEVRVVPGGILLVPTGTPADAIATIAEVARQRAEHGAIDTELAKKRLAAHGLKFQQESAHPVTASA